MEKHPTTIEGFDGTIENLAQRVGRMRYDTVAEFLDHLGKELNRQGDADRGRGRTKLAGMLSEAGVKIKDVQMHMENIFIMCKPFMKDELDDKK